LLRLLVGPRRTLVAFTFGFVLSEEDGFLEDGHFTFHCLGNKRVQEPAGILFFKEKHELNAGKIGETIGIVSSG
jgi:hypothetical protein